MARCGPPNAMKTRLSRHNGIQVFDCVFNGVGPRPRFLNKLPDRRFLRLRPGRGPRRFTGFPLHLTACDPHVALAAIGAGASLTFALPVSFPAVRGRILNTVNAGSGEKAWVKTLPLV